MPSTEERLAALEQTVSQMAPLLAGLGQERDALQARLRLLEEALQTGLADLSRAMEELRSRRPPIRRRLDELEERLAEVLPPPLGTTEPETSPPARETEVPHDAHPSGLQTGPAQP